MQSMHRRYVERSADLITSEVRSAEHGETITTSYRLKGGTMKLRIFAICCSLILGALTANANTVRENNSFNRNTSINHAAVNGNYINLGNPENFNNSRNNASSVNGDVNRENNFSASNAGDNLFTNTNRNNSNSLNEDEGNFNPNSNQNNNSRINNYNVCGNNN
jgi:hypothetical protein